MNYIKLIIMIFLISIMLSCENDVVNNNSEFYEFELKLKDKNNNDLVGYGLRFNPDLIKLQVKDSIIDIKSDQGYIKFHLSKLDKYNNDNYLLYLANDRTDTMKLKILKSQTTICGGDTLISYLVESLMYNNKIIQKVNKINIYSYDVILD